MAILVLGGAGYIGSHTVYELIDAGRDVVIADNLETGHIEAVHPKAKFYQGDIRNREFVDSVFESEHIDGVIHFAANSLVGESMTNPLKYYDNNLCGTKVLLESMVAHGIDKIVFSSTAATYGEPERVPILETDKTEPTNCYGETKRVMERMMCWTAAAPGLHLRLQGLRGSVLPGAPAAFLHAQLRLAAQVLPLFAAQLGGGAVRVSGPEAVAVGVKFPLPLV